MNQKKYKEFIYWICGRISLELCILMFFFIENMKEECRLAYPWSVTIMIPSKQIWITYNTQPVSHVPSVWLIISGQLRNAPLVDDE